MLMWGLVTRSVQAQVRIISGEADKAVRLLPLGKQALLLMPDESERVLISLRILGRGDTLFPLFPMSLAQIGPHHGFCSVSGIPSRVPMDPWDDADLSPWNITDNQSLLHPFFHLRWGFAFVGMPLWRLAHAP